MSTEGQQLNPPGADSGSGPGGAGKAGNEVPPVSSPSPSCGGPAEGGTGTPAAVPPAVAPPVMGVSPGRGAGASGSRGQARRSGRGWRWFGFGLLLVLALVVLVGLLGLVGLVSGVGRGSEGAYGLGGGFEEVVIEDRDAAAKIAVVEVEGIIAGGYLEAGEENMVEGVRHQLKRAEKDDAVKAVILRINSPGGEVLAADEIARLVGEFQAKTTKPVVAAMGGVAASGGYYVAAPCRWIVAHELTLTGSIGVIMHGYNYRGLMDKVGVRPLVFKSGRFKDMLSGDKTEAETSAEERQMVQGLVDETFVRFKKVVAQGREQARTANEEEGRTLDPHWPDFADGRVLSGRQAYDLGFVDELGGFHAAEARARKLAGVAEANLVRYQRPFRLGSFLRLLGSAESRAVRLDVGLELPPIRSGRLYFLFLPGA